MKRTGIRFAKREDAIRANETGDFSKSLKRGDSGWRKAPYEACLVSLPKAKP